MAGHHSKKILMSDVTDLWTGSKSNKVEPWIIGGEDKEIPVVEIHGNIKPVK